jgi:hypothetical protein
LVDVITLSVSDLEIEAINTSVVNSVWARDLYFGAWNFHDLLKSQLPYLFQAINCLYDVVLWEKVKVLSIYSQNGNEIVRRVFFVTAINNH